LDIVGYKVEGFKERRQAMEEVKVGCAVIPEVEEVTDTVKTEPISANELKEEKKMIKVGRPAPNFKAQAFFQGKFVNVSLDDYKGKWVYLCFYPGDFTFV